MKVMDHNAYPKSLRSKSYAELQFIIKDATEAQKANPSNPNNSYYADEVCYAMNELYRRRTA